MKNIPTELFQNALRGEQNATALLNIVVLSRLEAGLSSARITKTLYSSETEENKHHFREWLHGRGYSVATVSGAITESIGILSDDRNNAIKCIVDFSNSDKTFKIEIIGDLEESQIVKDHVVMFYNTKGATIATATRLTDGGNLVMDSKFIPEDNAQLARQSFYPWLSVSLSEYFDAFMASPENILVMFGPPGTGKSTFLRSFIMHKNYTAYLAYNKQVVESPAIINRFYRSKVDILAYEDIDNYLGAREDGNVLMSTILNASEGVIKHPGKKIVFSTNLSSINKIDPALLRVGRCFDILKFNLLSTEEAKNVVKDMGYPERDLESKKEWSLAEVLSEQVAEQQSVNRFGNKLKIGF